MEPNHEQHDQQVNSEPRTFETYRGVLRYEFEQRCQRNSAYSINSFARDLSVSPSQLSDILAERQGLSPSKGRTVGTRLGYLHEKLEWFVTLVAHEHARSPIAKKVAAEKLTRYQNGVISEELAKQLPFRLRWYHLAIRRMTGLKSFSADAPSIAQTLGLTEEETRDAISDLLASGMLETGPNQKLQISSNLTSPPTIPSKAVKIQVFRDMLNLAGKKQSERYERKSAVAAANAADADYFGLHFMTIRRSQMNEITTLIRELEDRIDDLTYRGDDHDDLVTVMINCFSLLQLKSGSQNKTE